MKRCKACGEFKPAGAFGTNFDNRRGRHYPRAECNRCLGDRRAGVRRDGDPDRRNARRRQRRKADRAAENAAKRRHYERHREQILAARRHRYATDEAHRIRTLERNHPERRIAGEASEYAAALRGDPCCYCGDPFEQIDHIDPVVHGGSHLWDNLTAACASCNARKCAKPLLLFLVREQDSMLRRAG